MAIIKKTQSAKKKKVRKNFDSPWKDALDIFFKDFATFCFPQMAKDIDWNKGYTFLDKELHSITKDAIKGQRTVDKLVKVFKQGGEEVWVLLHLEVQSQKDKHFQERMYTYQYRLFDRYHVSIASLAILIDSDKNWAPNIYQSVLWGTKLHFEYEVLKIASYQEQRKKLEKSSNPFATIILAQLEAMALTKEKNAEQHFISKLKLTRLLYEKGWSREYVYNLYRFIDWIIQLPQDLVLKYNEERHKLEEAKHMSYITQTEQLWLDQGRAKTEAKMVQNLYSTIKDEKQVAKLARMSLKKVKELLAKEKAKK